MVLLGSGTQTIVSAASWHWTPSLAISERYDDNLFLVRENRTSDFVSIVEPQLRVSSPAGQLTRYVQYRAQVERSTKNPELSTVDHFTDVEWSVPLTKSAIMTLSDRFNFSSDSTKISSLGAAVPRGDAYSNDSAIRLQLTRLTLSYQYGLQGFEAAGLSNGQFHTFQEQVTLPPSVRYAFTQSYYFRYFLRDGVVDLRSHTAGAGVRYHFTPTFQGGLEGGVVYWRTLTDDSFRTGPMVRLYLEKSFKQLRLWLLFLDDIQSQFQVSVEYGLRRTALQMNFSKELAAGGGFFRGTVDRQTASVNLQQQISQSADLALTAGYITSRLVNTGLSRTKAYRGQATFGYMIQPWLKTSVYYNYFEQESDDIVQPEFRRHQGMLSLAITMP